MKTLLRTAILVLAASGTLFAGSIDYLSNQSADYVRTFTRNASTDGADAVNYNPAGTAFMKDGLWIQANSQTFFKNYEQEADALEGYGYDSSYKSDKPSPIVPSLFAIYKQNDWAAFAAVTVPAGGGSVNYKDGVPFLPALGLGMGSSLVADSAKVEASSYYIGTTVGGSYRLPFADKIFSVSLAGRYIYSKKTYDIKAQYTGGLLAGDQSIEAEKTASGIGGIIGLGIKPMKELTIGIRYETETSLEFETNTDENTVSALSTNVGQLRQFDDGHKEKRDLPAMLAVGVAYDVMPQLRINFAGHYYFIKQADSNDDELDGAGNEFSVSYDDDYDNGYELGISVEYKVLPELLLSLGYNYTKMGSNEDTYNDFEYELDADTIAMGGKYTAVENLDISLGLAGTFYREGETDFSVSGKEKYNKTVYSIAFGVQYRFDTTGGQNPTVVSE